jgi:hypothetical protein
VDGKVLDWVKKKAAAIRVAEAKYAEILALSPAPPRWVIAAGSRAGLMWGKFVAEFRAAPIPKDWKKNGPVPGIPGLTYEELRAAYYEALDRASEPHKQHAKAAYKKCLDHSIKYQHFDEHSRRCEEWLSKHYGAEYHLVDELRGAPSRVNSNAGDRGRMVNRDGTPHR